MNNVSFKKGFFIVIMIVMFVGLGVIPSTGNNISNKSTLPIIISGNILYVGGSGEGNYTKIMDAIKDASDGDTVFVYDDSSPYYERVSIFKRINLIGEDKNTTIIDTEHKSTTVTINADNCLVSGFTIRNCERSGNEFEEAVVKIHNRYNVTINDNIITIGDIAHNDWTSAVMLHNSRHCTIKNNLIFETKHQGCTMGVVLLDGSSYNTISGNEISRYIIGISSSYTNLDYKNSNNIILGNHIHDNYWGISFRYDDNYNKILNNTIEFNEIHGIEIEYGHYNTISGNIISNNGEGHKFYSGIMITMYSSNNYISDNVISNNNPTGLYMLTSVNNVVTKNNFIDNWGKSGTREKWWGDVFFNYEKSQWKLFRLNCWSRNYWKGHSGNLPKAIHGDMETFFFFFPRIEFDWLPAKESYDIGV